MNSACQQRPHMADHQYMPRVSEGQSIAVSTKLFSLTNGEIMIQFILAPNKLAPAGQTPVGFHAMTLQSENRTSADFIKTMTSLRGGVTEGECAMWLDLVTRTFIFELQQGNNVNIGGFINAKVGIKGSFPDAESAFNPERNKLNVGITASNKVKEAV
jgi:hypothetical protein